MKRTTVAVGVLLLPLFLSLAPRRAFAVTNGDPRKACPSGRNCEEQERAADRA